ncbi:MAG: acetyl-CoA carboxylase carboxyltransferase subunit alpha [Spartobacteria bacterium]|nr:acetyl-CoA carboxylase carboxyltransferase subunit alpha [Spartobacteria bacterium]
MPAPAAYDCLTKILKNCIPSSLSGHRSSLKSKRRISPVTTYALPFEKPIVELEKKVQDLRSFSQNQDIDVSQEIEQMQQKIDDTRRDIYGHLTPWQKVQVARHPTRPYPIDYISNFSPEFLELHGDRLFADDHAIVGGFGKIADKKVLFIGTCKGRDTKSNLKCNFGCAYPEGYRKALRLMKLAAKFNLPIVTFIDTPGAFPGVESEERHIAEAIAVNLRESFTLPVPIVVVITGEGGSGGALGIGIGNRVLILEHSYYSVISPEGCAAILWKDRAFADKAAEALHLTSDALLEMKLVDEIIPEPVGGAHSDYEAVFENMKNAILRNLEELQELSTEELMQQRYEKFRAMGVFEEPEVKKKK